ncbi:MAG: ATP-binding domain-containing protein [Oscillospiraceae bacterium]|nr:ATP-binding domain-containing protein [Oscillospiraceae bacterium]
MENCIAGVPAKLHFCPSDDDVLGALDDTLQGLFDDGVENVVILTCRKETDSALAPYLVNSRYPAGKKNVLFTTCRKFKGLEADAVILVDVDEDTFLGNGGQNVLLYYVGTSRARLRLDIMTSMGSDSCARVLGSLGKAEKAKRPQRDLARVLNALPVMETVE